MSPAFSDRAILCFYKALSSEAMKFGVVVFPGSNCDHDAYCAVERALGQVAAFLWHESRDLAGSDVVILPGGFAYGDYLRTGAIARFAPIMSVVKEFAAQGGLVLGICNGFQILLEAGLLPGAMLRNRGLKFICRPVHLRVENVDTPFTNACRPGQVLEIPIAHGEGNYYTDAETLTELERDARVVFRYATPEGEITAAANPNGSLHITLKMPSSAIVGSRPRVWRIRSYSSAVRLCSSTSWVLISGKDALLEY